MPPREKTELLRVIEAHVRSGFAPGTPADELERWLGYELASVDIHRRNLVPFVRGHGARAGHRVLDFGSGPGTSACAMALDLGVTVTGIEPNRANEVVAPLWAEYCGVQDRVSFVFLEDTLHLPFPDASFDYVLASSVLEYVPGNRGAYLREMARVLVPGGRLLIAGTSNAAWPREVHSKTWLVNWMPNLGPRLRRLTGKTNPVERGITFGELEASLPGLRFVRGEADQLEAFAERLAQRAHRLGAGVEGLVAAWVSAGLARADRAALEGVGWPAEAFLPWLNVAFEKPALPG